ncbi:hypothetical protein E4U54_002067, partial [Claviceps lovelessii]
STTDLDPLLLLSADVTLKSRLTLWTSFQMPKDMPARSRNRTMMMMATAWFRWTMLLFAV